MRKLAVFLFWLSVLVAVVAATVPHPLHLPGEPSDKFQHMLAFAVMAGLAAIAFPDVSKWRLLAWLCLLGGGIELVQAIPPLNRDSEMADWGVDTVAAALVLMIVHPIGRWIGRDRANA